MRLEQKQFVPFMIAVAAITMVVIVLSSFNFTNKQHARFVENVVESDSLTTLKMRVIGAQDSVSIVDLKGQKSILVFWASWSEKSTAMLDEIRLLQREADSLQVIAALVKDAEESLEEEREYPNFIYSDGAHFFNYLKVPGFPTYILFDEQSNVLKSNIGYEKGIGYDSLKVYLND
ncbi:TlpA family protein disulfide reductase [Gracilimonas halophila]|uniref:TlpA family protein disulfide reductase n=1 Tax=Gracilimonas halophila TaxID=1834464 RepID=A0ABW5JPW8_9BACT